MIPKIDRPTGQPNFQVVWTESGAGYAFSYDKIVAFRPWTSGKWVLSGTPTGDSDEEPWTTTTWRHLSHISMHFAHFADAVPREDFLFQLENHVKVAPR